MDHSLGSWATGALLRAVAVIAAALAAFTLVLSVPQHVMDWDDGDVAAPAAAMAHGTARTVIDHHALGHACAGHCAAHVLGQAPHAIVMALPAALHAAWLGSAAASPPSRPSPPLERPPRG